MKALASLTHQRFWKTWKSLIYIAVSAGVAVLIYALDLADSSKSKVVLSLISFFLCHIFVSQLFGEFFLDALEADLHELKASQERAAKDRALTARLRNGHQALTVLDPVIASAGQSTADALLRRMSVDQDSSKISLSGRDFAYLCYAKFWESLVKHQTIPRAHGNLIARMTHTSDIKGWIDEYMQGMRQLHRSFADNGGTSLRVLVDRRPRGAGDLSRYIGLMDKMEEDGVFVAYLNRDCDDFPESALRADFCIVAVADGSSPELPHYVLRWKLDGALVKGLTLSNSIDKFKLHDGEWSLLEAALEKVDYSADTKDAGDADRLRVSRDRFLGKCRHLRRA